MHAITAIAFDQGGGQIGNSLTITFEISDGPSCSDGIKNQGEAGIDCGSPCTAVCPTCTDGIQNQGEAGVDCGGPCPNACPGEQVPWLEDFEGLPQGTTADSGPTLWTAMRNGGGTLDIQNGALTINDDGPEGLFTTGVIDISGSPVDVSLDLYSVGDLESSGTYQDYVKLFAKVDGGAEELIAERFGVWQWAQP